MREQRGSCLCGEVSFHLDGGPFSLSWCHCAMCRKFHGHALPAVRVPTAQIKWDAGAAAKVSWFASSKHGRRGSCSRCGSALFFRGENDAHIEIAAGALDSPAPVSVAAHIYAPDKGDWYDLPDDGLPRYPGDPPKSS